MKAIEIAIRQIQAGVIEIRPDGTIWKLKNLNAMPRTAPSRMDKKSKRGYMILAVWEDGKCHLMTAHRLIWTYLNGPIPVGMDINHKDGNRINNRPENLEIMTRGDNLRHSYRELGRKLPKTTPTPLDWEAISGPAKSLRAQGLSYRLIGKRLKVSQTSAYRAVNMK